MTATVPPQSAPNASSRHRASDEQAVRAIIASARQSTEISARVVYLLSGLSGLLWFAAFYPLNWGPLAFLAPVPLLILARVVGRPRHLYRAVYITWLAVSLLSLSWMAANLPMVAGWIAMSIYMAFYPVLFLLTTRVATIRLKVPLIVAAPVTWTGLELIRGYLFTGFAWYFLGHTQWRFTPLIQISDLVGVYGVSYVIMVCAASIALWIPQRWLLRVFSIGMPEFAARPMFRDDSVRSQLVGGMLSLAVLGAAIGYGYWRMGTSTFTTGPRIALAQGNFPSRLYPTATQAEVWQRHNRLTAMSVEHQPDFVIWPESAFRWPLFAMPEDISDADLTMVTRRSPLKGMTADDWRDASKSVSGQLGDLATQANAAMLIGGSTIYGDAEHGVRRYNSAIFSRPELGVTGRYDKQHRVLLGEYIPLRKELPFLQLLSPYTSSFSIDAGTATAVFEYNDYSIAPVICFEDTVPHLVRRMVRDAAQAERPIDVLVNVSNDGWFDHSSEQPQHLVTSLFRAVETRTPMARAANTGVSGVVDGNGRLVKPVATIQGQANRSGKPSTVSFLSESGRFRQDEELAIVVDVPLDPRDSLYVRFGDWFAIVCAGLTLGLLGWGILRRKRPLPA